MRGVVALSFGAARASGVRWHVLGVQRLSEFAAESGSVTGGQAVRLCVASGL